MTASSEDPSCGGGFHPIRDYALIGDCHGAALVMRDGTIDWCCLGRFDADPVLCRLLDERRGGHLAVRPTSPYQVTRSYAGDTAILRTVFTTAGGSVAVTDFMPVGRQPGASAHDYVTLNAPLALVRRIEGLTGSVEMALSYRPSLSFGTTAPQLRRTARAVTTDAGLTLHLDWDELDIAGDLAKGRIVLAAGERRDMVLADDRTAAAVPLAAVDAWLAATQAFWTEWSAYCRYRGPDRDCVMRSAITLKLLTWAPSGAIVAAPTTSLPEWIGGERNWDYRYCWLRDAAFSLYALAALGYGGEARRFSEFLPQACARTFPDLRIMYRIDGDPELEERVLDHLDGYCGSRPVRTGNGAHRQRQIDVYGEVLDWASVHHALGGRMTAEMRGMLAATADFAAAHWREPDQGIWEMRGPPRHFVHGKAMSWVALDRAVALLGDNGRWARERAAIVDDVLRRGIDPRRGCLTQAYGETGMDAALLLLPFLGFPAPEPILAATIDAVQQDLAQGDLVHRYRSDDGVAGEEGAFLICSFWLVDALLWLGRTREAESMFARLAACGNDVGLFSEAIHPDGTTLLGNFPQAFTHLALIGSATNLELLRKSGPAALRGTFAERASRGVGRVFGLGGLWAAFTSSGSLGRLWPSAASILRSR
ncbi:glycoside hydrolase family 15 protein [Elioraea sp.]|uniref:glycoside hydrolase family 15 protein n=1 Tax=Elioraea sp. TaxID=2185103 RepID=UPI003F6E84AC